MDSKDLFSILNSTLWQDYKGFVREEKEKDKNCVSVLECILVLVSLSVVVGIFAAVVECPQIMLAIPITSPFVLINYLVNNVPQLRIKKNAYDIEATVDDIKLIRNKRGKMGLCQWEKYTSCCLLCKSKYDSIKRTENNTFILVKKGKYGLYSGLMKKIIAECRYDKIEPISDEIFALYYKGSMSKINYKGDRILI